MSEFKHPPALAEFLRTAARLDALLGQYGRVRKARGIPQDMLRVFDERVKIAGRDGWDSDNEAKAKAVEFAKEIATRARAEVFFNAEREREAALRAIADEITSIRGNLAAIATRCAIELGGTAKDLRFEAEYGGGYA